MSSTKSAKEVQIAFTRSCNASKARIIGNISEQKMDAEQKKNKKDRIEMARRAKTFFSLVFSYHRCYSRTLAGLLRPR